MTTAFNPTRRVALAAILSLAALPSAVMAQASSPLSAQDAHDMMASGELIVIDIRSRQEWLQSGLAEGAWPISLHEPDFGARLQAAQQAAGGAQIGLICATGGRTGHVMRALRQAGVSGFVDIPEGMMGAASGPGWIAARLPLTDLATAEAALPSALRR